MSNVNPFLAFIKSVSTPKEALLIFDVDLAIQPTMSTETTDLQKQHMWEVYDRTDGGVLFFTGRTHQSVNKTFGHDYAGVFEHYSMARFGHGQTAIAMAPEINIPVMGNQARELISAWDKIHIVGTPAEIRERSDMAVFVEEKNTSIALVHTLRHGEDHAAHLESLRSILQPTAHQILNTMQLGQTHEVKTGGDAVEIVPKGMSSQSSAGLYLPDPEIKRIRDQGLSKATAIHNFQTLFSDRKILMTGDSSPDLDAMVEAKIYDGQGVYVSNGIKLSEKYAKAVDHEIPHHTMTWGLIENTVLSLREMAPTVAVLPKAGGMVPDIKGLQ